MKHSYIADNQISDRYVMGRLRPREMKQFEQHFIHCQECQREIELSENLHQGMQLALGAVAQPSVASRPWHKMMVDAISAKIGLPFGTPGKPVLNPHRLRPLLAASAGALVLVSVATSVVLYQMRGDAYAPSANTPVINLFAVRSTAQSEPASQISLQAEPGWMVFSMELPGAKHPRYRAALRNSDGRSIWTGDKLVANPQDEITLSLHSSMLAPGDFVFQVEGITASDTWTAVARFPFRVK